MASIHRYNVTEFEDGSAEGWSLDTGQKRDWATDLRLLVHSGDAQYVGKDPKNYLVNTTLSNEVYYQDSAITDLNVVNYLGTGLSPVYGGGGRDTAQSFVIIPKDANHCVIEVQDTGVGIKWLIESVAGNTSISNLRDNGQLLRDGDILTLKSRDEIQKFAFISAVDIPALNVPDAKVLSTYSRIPEDGRSH